jgi:hypothetical protein
MDLLCLAKGAKDLLNSKESMRLNTHEKTIPNPRFNHYFIISNR